MLGGEVFERFLAEAPVCVMARGTLERMFSAEAVDAMFRQRAHKQYERELLFSSVVEVTSLVVLGVHRSVHAAYQRRSHEFRVSVKSLYNKLQGVEPHVSQGLVRQTAEGARAVLGCWKSRAPLLAGYRVKVIDGNHLTGTERRLKPLRGEGGAALPGLAVAVLLPDEGLIEDLVLAEDAYTQETQLLGPIVERLQARDLVLADRLYCTRDLLFEIADREACFVIRQHLGHLAWELVGPRRALGRSEAGELAEQAVDVRWPGTERVLRVRRITVELAQPTRDGERVLHVLTNLPESAAGAAEVAALYRRRWTIETAFQELTTSLRCELGSLGHPAAALFGFAVAVACFNMLAVIRAALEQAHPRPAQEPSLSTWALADELRGTYRGLMIAVPPEQWRALPALSPARWAQTLVRWARQVSLARYQTHRRGPKTRTPRPFRPTQHVATARLLKPPPTTPRPANRPTTAR